MQIEAVTDAGTLYQVTVESGLVLWVPKDSENADYVRVQAWIAAGGMITS